MGSRAFRLVTAILPLIALMGCKGSSAPPPAGAPGDSVQAVNVVAVESRTLNTRLMLPGQIVPYETVDIYPKVTGFLDTIRVDRGSHVHAGEPIIRLSAPELVSQRAQAEAGLRNAQSQLAAAQAKLASDNGTYLHLAAAAKTPGVVAENDLLVAKQAVEADHAQVEAAASNVQAAHNALRSVEQLESYLEIRAPFSGIVTSRNLHPGALVGPAAGSAGSQPIVQIEDADRLRLIVPVPEAYIAGLAEGRQIAFSVPAYPGVTFHATLKRISDQVNQATRTMPVELDLHNGVPRITPGTFANVEWPVQRAYATLFVPATAITTNLQRRFVIRIQQGKAEWIDVKTGLADGGKTEVFGDLHPGDQVVARASDDLASGTSVVARQAQGR